MSGLRITLIVFVIVEFLNVLELYFMQDNAVFNGLSIFSAWEESKKYPEIHNFIRYLVNWLAGVKLIVIMILAALVSFAPDQTLVIVSIALVTAIASFYWRLYPMLKDMKTKGQILPLERPKQLALMLSGLEFGFISMIVVTALG